MGKLLNSEARTFLSTAAPVVCAIPLHERRFRERKYDHARLLALALAKRSDRPILQALTRHRATERQVGLSEVDRELNVAGAFRASSAVRNQRVLLVDDVFTTGATARAAAAALLEAGADEVQVLTLARAFSV